MARLQDSLERWLPRARAEVEQYRLAVRLEQIGWVERIGDGIATVSGLPDARLDELLRFADGTLVIKGEKKHEATDEKRLWSERYYGRFERRIPVEEVEEEKASAAFKNGVLTVTLPKKEGAISKVRRIAINGK